MLVVAHAIGEEQIVSADRRAWVWPFAVVGAGQWGPPAPANPGARLGEGRGIHFACGKPAFPSPVLGLLHARLGEMAFIALVARGVLEGGRANSMVWPRDRVNSPAIPVDKAFARDLDPVNPRRETREGALNMPSSDVPHYAP